MSNRSQGFNSFFLRALSSSLCCPLAVDDVGVKSNVNLILKILVEPVRDKAMFIALPRALTCAEGQGEMGIC